MDNAFAQHSLGPPRSKQRDKLMDSEIESSRAVASHASLGEPPALFRQISCGEFLLGSSSSFDRYCRNDQAPRITPLDCELVCWKLNGFHL